MFQGGDEALHHFVEFGRLSGGEIGLLKGIVFEVKELVGLASGLDEAAVGGDVWVVVVNDLPVTAAVGGEVVAAVGSMRVMHEELLGTSGVWLAGEQDAEVAAIDQVSGWGLHAGEFEDSGENVGDVCHLSLDLAGGDGKFLLEGVVWVWLGPGRDERHAGAAFVVGAFFAPERSGAGNFMLVAKGGVGAVVTEKEDEGVLGNAGGFEVVDEIAKGFIHAFDKSSKGLGSGRFAAVGIVRSEAGI